VVARRVAGWEVFDRATMTGSVAQPTAAPAGRRWGRWIAASLAALILPIVCAGSFIGYRWWSGKGGSATQQGSLHAGIEIGSKGVKSVVLEVFSDAEYGYDVEPQNDAKTVNTTLVAGLAANNQFDPEALKDTARAVGKLYGEARNDLKVPEDHIYIVGSSGLFSPLRKKKNLSGTQRAELIKSNKEALAQAVREVVGKPVRFIDAADEAEQSFKGIVPRHCAGESALFDIGGGNTKGAYASAPNTFDTLELPYGTKTYFEFVKRESGKRRAPFGKAVRRLADAALRQPLHAQIERKRGFVNRQRVYLAGGVVWGLANYVHPENRRAMVELTTDDLNTFEKMLGQDRQAVIDSCLAKIVADDKIPKDQVEKIRKAAEKDLKRVNDTYSAEELRAGLEVLRAVSDEGEFKGKKLYFARHGYYGWLLSYVEAKGAE
jgi:hypothetical protein